MDNLEKYNSSCKSCWYVEGYHCYFPCQGIKDNKERMAARVIASGKCENYKSKRSVFDRVFKDTGISVTIVSEELAKNNLKIYE